MRLKTVLCVILLAVGLLLAQSGDEVMAKNISAIAITFNILALFLLLLATFFGLELYRMMKGGELATSWGYITVGIITLFFGYLSEFLASAGLWDYPNWFPSAINLIVAIMLTLGIFSQRKILS